MAFPLSVLDLSPVDAGSSSTQALQNTIRLAQLADRLGYTRYWFAEHHNTSMLASATPEIMIAHVAQSTEHIRVGSGGVMLPNHAPLKVAEAFRLLEALHPGRIDLGIGRAPGTDPRTALALRGSRSALGAEDFPEQLAALRAFSDLSPFSSSSPLPVQSIRATPVDVQLPPIWLLGSSDYSAQAAAELGVGFAFAHHINPGFATLAIKIYRSLFVPSEYLQKPNVILTTSVICADTDEQAEALAASMELAFVRLRSGQAGPLPSPEEAQAYAYTPMEQMMRHESRARLTLGRPEVVREKLIALMDETEADELMITSIIYGFENRARSYELLAEAFHLSAPV